MIDVTRLKDIRENHDIRQEKMAEVLEVNRSAYSLWEIGINIIPLKNLSDFADDFNLSLDYVLGLTNERKPRKLIKGFDIKKLGNNIRQIRLQNELSQ